MNAKKMMIVAAVFAAAGSAFAATDVTGTFEDFTNVPSTKTRAEVTAEVAQARGQNQVADTEYAEPARNFASSKTRAEVVAELKEAAAQGQLATTEWVEPTTMMATSHRTRDEVRAEVARSAKN